MKISIIEPLGVPDEILNGLANLLKEKGLEVVKYGTIKELPSLEERVKDADVIILANTNSECLRGNK